MNCCTEINIFNTTEPHQLFSSKAQSSNKQASPFNDRFKGGMELSAILNPEPSANPPQSVQAHLPGLTLPSIDEILPSHEFTRLMQRRMEGQTYVPITDMDDPRAARFLRQIQGFRTKWEQDEYHQLSNERGFRFDHCFWRSYHTFLQPIDGKRRDSIETTHAATVQSAAHHPATPTKSTKLVENAGGNAEKVLVHIRARKNGQTAKHENNNMDRLKRYDTGVFRSRSEQEDGEECSTSEGAATSPPAPLAQSLFTNQATVPTPQWAIKYRPGNLPLLGLEPGKWGDHITAEAPGKMPRPGKAFAPDHSVFPRKFEWNWGLYTLLARIPGGRAKLDVLYRMCVEWCPAVNLKSHNNRKEMKEKGNSTCRRSLSQNGCFISEAKMWRLANIGETKIKKPGPEKNKNPALTWKKRKTQKAISGAGKSKSQRRRHSALHCESPSLHSALLISSFEPSPDNDQHLEHLVPTSPDYSQPSTGFSPWSQYSHSNIQSPSAEPETLVVAEHDQGNTQVPKMAKSLTFPGPQFKAMNDHSSPSARARRRRRLLPSNKSKGTHEISDQQDEIQDPEMVMSLPVCSTDSRCPDCLGKKTGQQDNTPDQEMVNGAAVMLSLSTAGFNAINSSSSEFTPINAHSGAPTNKRKLEEGNDVSGQAATRRRIG